MSPTEQTLRNISGIPLERSNISLIRKAQKAPSDGSSPGSQLPARAPIKISPVIKLELHAHTDADPADRISHSARDLVDRAASLGYGALAVTLHDRYFDPAPHAAYARERGVVLLPRHREEHRPPACPPHQLPRCLRRRSDVRRHRRAEAEVRRPRRRATSLLSDPKRARVCARSPRRRSSTPSKSTRCTRRSSTSTAAPGVGARARQATRRQHRSSSARPDGHDLLARRRRAASRCDLRRDSCRTGRSANRTAVVSSGGDALHAYVLGRPGRSRSVRGPRGH